ncbi:MFS transporter [Streptomyces sp. NPDC051162]|uniref:MFS transporter n=1 Tax=Streptomyces sp. NPDC051162 TaxID=3154747 RepID=UPI0034193DF7
MKTFETFKAMKSGPVSRLVLGSSASRLATFGFNAAMAVYLLDLTGKASDLGLALLVGTVPFFALSLITGVVCDRFNRKNIILVCDALRAVVAVVFLLLAWKLDTDARVALVYITVFCFSVCESFVMTTFSSIVPDVIDEKDILDTNNLLMGIGDVIRMLGPVIGVLLYSSVGFEASAVATAVLFALAFLCQRGVKYTKASVPDGAEGLLAIVREELGMFRQLITEDARRTSLMGNGFTTHLFMYPFITVGLPFVITQVFEARSVEYGYLEAVCALGGILSLLLVPHTKHWGTSKSLLMSMIGMVLGAAVFLVLLVDPAMAHMEDNAVTRLGVLTAGCFLVFLAFGVYGVYFVSFLHETVRSEMLGKGQSLVMMFNALGRMLGFALFGYLFDHSLRAAVVVFVVGMSLKLLVHVPFIRADRKLRQTATASEEPAPSPVESR